MGTQLELLGESGKTHKVNVQVVIIMYLVDELVKCLPDDKVFGHATDLHLKKQRGPQLVIKCIT